LASQSYQISARATKKIDPDSTISSVHIEMADYSSLSSGELDELNDLLDREENGDDVNQTRLNELDLFDKWRNGDPIKSGEERDIK
jgi:hypothetical protein